MRFRVSGFRGLGFGVCSLGFRVLTRFSNQKGVGFRLQKGFVRAFRTAKGLGSRRVLEGLQTSFRRVSDMF